MLEKLIGWLKKGWRESENNSTFTAAIRAAVRRGNQQIDEEVLASKQRRTDIQPSQPCEIPELPLASPEPPVSSTPIQSRRYPTISAEDEGYATAMGFWEHDRFQQYARKYVAEEAAEMHERMDELEAPLRARQELQDEMRRQQLRRSAMLDKWRAYQAELHSTNPIPEVPVLSPGEPTQPLDRTPPTIPNPQAAAPTQPARPPVPIYTEQAQPTTHLIPVTNDQAADTMPFGQRAPATQRLAGRDKR